MSSMQMPWLLTMQMSWLLRMQMSWLQTQQMSWLQTSHLLLWLQGHCCCGYRDIAAVATRTLLLWLQGHCCCCTRYMFPPHFFAQPPETFPSRLAKYLGLGPWDGLGWKVRLE